MAEWLCSGLQIRVRRFDSGLRLQNFTSHPPVRLYYCKVFASFEKQARALSWGASSRYPDRLPIVSPAL